MILCHDVKWAVSQVPSTSPVFSTSKMRLAGDCCVRADQCCCRPRLILQARTVDGVRWHLQYWWEWRGKEKHPETWTEDGEDGVREVENGR